MKNENSPQQARPSIVLGILIFTIGLSVFTALHLRSKSAHAAQTPVVEASQPAVPEVAPAQAEQKPVASNRVTVEYHIEPTFKQ